MNFSATITFSRDCYDNYKKLRNEAVNNKQNTFVHGGSLVHISRADFFLKQFDVLFANKNITEATIPWTQ